MCIRDSEWPLPDPKAGEVRIRIHAISVNPVDVKMRLGRIPVELPTVLGRDVAGTIDVVGEGVTPFKRGDSVFAVLFGPRSNGAYAQYVSTHAAFVSLSQAASPIHKRPRWASPFELDIWRLDRSPLLARWGTFQFVALSARPEPARPPIGRSIRRPWRT